jgi:adenylate cyclase
MGSDDFFAYTALGDRVNLGARLEGQTKSYGVSIILSEATYRAVADHMVCRELDLVRVKGKQAPERIYELLGPVDTERDLLPFVDTFHAGLALFRARRFAEARSQFEAARVARGDDRCAEQYRDLAAHLELHPPPPDWDGVREATTK